MVPEMCAEERETVNDESLKSSLMLTILLVTKGEKRVDGKKRWEELPVKRK